MNTYVLLQSALGRAEHSTRLRLGWLAAVLVWLLPCNLPLLAEPLAGGSFRVIGGVASGGGASSGGPFSIVGWAPSAGAGLSSGEGFSLTCGLLGVYVVSNGEVALKVELLGNGNVRLWWPVEVTGYQLRFTTALGPAAVWLLVEPAPVANTFTTGPLFPARYFRLQRPE